MKRTDVVIYLAGFLLGLSGRVVDEEMAQEVLELLEHLGMPATEDWKTK